MHWDKEVTQQLIQQGLTREQAGFVVGLVAEHRQTADMFGYTRGYTDGYAAARVDVGCWLH
jgi:hypothetical protein